jgi:formate dehydrogenase iron-sulfur subunit
VDHRGQGEGGAEYVVCNADEGDSGTFADRMVMEGDPFMLIEGMAIAAHAVGATKGYVYIRSEYPHAIAKMEAAVRACAHIIAPFVLEVRTGAGAYVCGEETSLLNSLEGKRGEVRAKPPLPALEGLFGKPTVVNNVLTLAAVPWIWRTAARPMRRSASAGPRARCRSSWPATSSMAACSKSASASRWANWSTCRRRHRQRPAGARGAGGRPAGRLSPAVGFPPAVRLRKLRRRRWPDRPRRPDRVRRYGGHERAGPLRHGVLRGGKLRQVHALPHRLHARGGSDRPHPRPRPAHRRRGGALPQTHNARKGARTLAEEIALLEDLCETMKFGSLCALGGFTPYPVLSALRHWPEDFGADFGAVASADAAE